MKDFFAALFLIIAIVAAIIFAVNFSNEKIDGGYAGYVYSEPIFGSKEFKQVIKGPGSTGMVWRQNSIKICVTPYTQTETFDDVRSSDQLKMKAESYLVYRIDSEKVKEFVENLKQLEARKLLLKMLTLHLFSNLSVLKYDLLLLSLKA